VVFYLDFGPFHFLLLLFPCGGCFSFIIIQVVLDAGIRLKKFELVKSRGIIMDDLQEVLLVA
jgi:hypothetical protein